MIIQIEPRHDLSPNEVDAIEDRLYDDNTHATGRYDDQGLGFVIRDELGQMVGVAAGYTWAGILNLNRCGSMRHIETRLNSVNGYIDNLPVNQGGPR